MNHLDLLHRLRSIEEGVDQPLFDQDMEECGDNMPVEGQGENSVTMNVSMNGKGAEGIRDLMAVLRNLESGEGDGKELVSMEPEQEPEGKIVVGLPGEEPDDGEEMPLDDEFKNSMHGQRGPQKLSIDDILQTGNDMFSKGSASPAARAPGTNPLRPVQEGLVNRLADMYEEIKLREGISTNHRHAANSPKVSHMEHQGQGEFSAVVDGKEYHVYAPVDFGSNIEEEAKWVGTLTVKDPTGAVIHHTNPVFRAIDDELSKMHPNELG